MSISPLTPRDRDELAAGYRDLSMTSRFHRFLAAIPELTPRMLDHLVDGVDGVNHVALKAIVDTPSGPAGIGVARIIRYPHVPDEADIAVTIRDEYQGMGVATALLRELLAQRPTGLRRLRTEVALDNVASLAMLRRLGPTTLTPLGGGVAEVVVELVDVP